MIVQHQWIYTFNKEVPIFADVTYNTLQRQQPVILFLHGFKSFKDWGAWPQLAHYFAAQGFAFCKINFSGSGVGATSDTLTEFNNLDLFAHNTISQQLADVQLIGKILQSNTGPFNLFNQQQIIIMGHSMGGGLGILCTQMLANATQLITLNAIADYGIFVNQFDNVLWQQQQVMYTFNARTQQQMPLHYTLYQDYIKHQQAFNILYQAAQVTIPWLHVYGTSDETVNPSNAQLFKNANSNITVLAIPEATHTFGATHPPLQALPSHLLQCADLIIKNIIIQ
jgi:uncharacterized protein